MALLKDQSSIKKPVNNLIIHNDEDLIIQILDYYRCLDTFDHVNDNENSESEDSDDSSDSTEEYLYSKDKQKELSYTRPLLIKLFGILETGHSITVNLQGFEPFFYIKIPDEWEKKQCQVLIAHVRTLVYYRYKEHLLKTQIIVRKPFKEFTGTDKFKFLKLQFKNKESYDQFSYKFAEPIKIPGLNGGKSYKYDLYESNIEPILKFIHLTKINPSGWAIIPKDKYSIIRDRTSLTNFEIKLQWDQIQPHEKLENAAINVMAFDIEADSAHGDFPIGIKKYQKLSQEFITLYNEFGVTTKKNKIHPLFQKSAKNVIQTILRLVFDDNYNNYNIHQIHTIGNIKPNPETIDQLKYIIHVLFETFTNNEINLEDLNAQLNDLFEYNLPLIDTSQDHNSHYGLLTEEIISQLVRLSKNNNKQFREHPMDIIGTLLNLAFNDYFDGFNVSNIFTKNNIKPDTIVLDALVPTILILLQDCANFIHFKKVSETVKQQFEKYKQKEEQELQKGYGNKNKFTSTSTDDKKNHSEIENLSQDFFVNQLTALFDQYLPPVEGDKLIQIGSTFQLTNQSDCYLKHIICLNTCESINNDEMITYENKNIYLPVEELASDLVMYEKQLGQHQDLSKEQLSAIIKNKIKDVKTWDVAYRKSQCQKAAEYRRIKQSQTDHSHVVVEFYDNERDILLAWKELILTNDPDVVIGYNVFGFDFKFLYDRSLELGCSEEFCQLGRLKGFIELFYEQKLSSAGLGDNTLKYIPMTGRVVIDLYKVVQKDHKLDSYKLDSVCHKFLYKEKVDLPPKEIFSLQKGDAKDRKKIATYCLVDCILCNRLVLKLEIIGNNIAMANVCKVPFPYLFLRGQGVKIFSLVSEFCSREGYLIPVLPKANPSNDESYEGAIVLKPETGIYFDPVVVGDFSSLYPSSMISENISHDSFVEIGGKYDNLPKYTYVDVVYDVYKTTVVPGTKKKKKEKCGEQTCRYAQLPDGKKSVLPSILINLLAARKVAQGKVEEEKSKGCAFKAKIWDGLQLAYKVTANSLYGQCGAKTSPISKVEIAASTTAVGRRMITFSRDHILKAYKDRIITLDLESSGVYDSTTKQVKPTKYTEMQVHVKDSYCVYGDTDSVFIKFNMFDLQGNKITGPDSVNISIALCNLACKEISNQLKKPQNIRFEKAILPFILISKKRYHGRYYTKMDNPSFYDNSMGIVLKRRDNAPIVKQVFGGAIDIIMNEHDIKKAFEFVKSECTRVLQGDFSLEKFIISKTLKSYYKKPRQIAHNVLACRQAQRDPGNRFEPNDRVPYAFIVNNSSKKLLQGDRIETPDFIRQNKLTPDYKAYITNQIMKPVAQIFELVPGLEKMEEILTRMLDIYENERTGNISLDNFVGKKTTPDIKKLFDLIEQAKNERKTNTQQIICDDEEEDSNDDPFDDDSDGDGGVEGTSNYDDPNF